MQRAWLQRQSGAFYSAAEAESVGGVAVLQVSIDLQYRSPSLADSLTLG
jgi:hypothetical protein